jgi:hypothetical protein
MPSAHTLAIVVVLLLVLLWLVARVLRRGRRGLPYYSREYLLTRGELAFYRVLRQALPPRLHVSFKARLSDVIGCPGWAWKQGFGAKISQKHLDFVVVDADTTAVRFAVELDDRSHQRRDRQARDLFLDRALAAAGVPLVRVPAAASYDPARLREELRAVIRASAAA